MHFWVCFCLKEVTMDKKYLWCDNIHAQSRSQFWSRSVCQYNHFHCRWPVQLHSIVLRSTWLTIESERKKNPQQQQQRLKYKSSCITNDSSSPRWKLTTSKMNFNTRTKRQRINKIESKKKLISGFDRDDEFKLKIEKEGKKIPKEEKWINEQIWHLLVKRAHENYHSNSEHICVIWLELSVTNTIK